MTKAIYFDLDGTIADLYGVPNWLDKLLNEDSTPYEKAKPLVNMNTLARKLNSLQRKGYSIGIISWLCKDSTKEYDKKVTKAKIKWLKKHLGSVKFDEINIVTYGVPKETVAKNPYGLLFDDEERNRKNWIGTAHSEKNIMDVLRELV